MSRLDGGALGGVETFEEAVEPVDLEPDGPVVAPERDAQRRPEGDRRRPPGGVGGVGPGGLDAGQAALEARDAGEHLVAAVGDQGGESALDLGDGPPAGVVADRSEERFVQAVDDARGGRGPLLLPGRRDQHLDVGILVVGGVEARRARALHGPFPVPP